MPNCTHLLYTCNRWNCDTCAQKKLFWLREQAITFARGLSFQQTHFTTLKNFSQADLCELAVKDTLSSAKRAGKACGVKLEYFYVIANHEFAGFHAHIISNLPLHPNLNAQSHQRPTRNLHDSVLYLVDNLKRSLGADYASTRRYSGSSLLNKQSMKRWFKLRCRLWSIKTRLTLGLIILRYLKSLGHDHESDHENLRCVGDRAKCDPTPEYLPKICRPPP